MTQDKSNPVFSMRFVSTERGIKAEQRVKGRIAFPSNRGTQPADGETWRVQIAGENPKKTVFFLTLLEKVEAKETKPALQGLLDGPGRLIISGEPGKGRSSILKVMGEMWKHGAPLEQPASVPPASPADVMFVPDYIFAPGGDAVAQAKAWLTPVTKIDLTNLKFAHAQKLGAADEEASEIAGHLRAAIAFLDEAGTSGDALCAKLKAAGRDGEAASELFAARKRSAAAAEAKRVLQVDTLSYGRLKQSYTKKSEADTPETNPHLKSVKDDLDARRTVVNAEVEAAKEALSSAETGRIFAYSADEVDALVVVLEQLDAVEASKAQTLVSIKTNLRFYEDRIDALRKSAS